ncbi:MAG: hypothetical protein PHH13_04090 [Candidatus Peribacteraceae bacterium]|nr:hypothetical protein [Candidatus Peribacteraceae bacterium]
MQFLFGGDDNDEPTPIKPDPTGVTGSYNAGDDIGEAVGEGHDPIEDNT